MLKCKIDYCDEPYRGEFEIPFEGLVGVVLLMFLSCQCLLMLEGIRCIEESPFPEVLLSCILHLNYELTAVIGYAGDIDNHLAVLLCHAHHLGIDETEVPDECVSDNVV